MLSIYICIKALTSINLNRCPLSSFCATLSSNYKIESFLRFVSRVLFAYVAAPLAYFEIWRILTKKINEVFYSSSNGKKPEYADFPPKEKFQAITGIIMSRLSQFPKAFCGYSGGSDSDIMIDLIENARKINPSLPSVEYGFFNTGLEMQAIKDHVKDVAQKYGVEIKEIKSKPNIVQATRKYGVPFMSKLTSRRLRDLQNHPEVPLSICNEFEEAEDKLQKLNELYEKYPKCKMLIQWLCSCDKEGNPVKNTQFGIKAIKNFFHYFFSSSLERSRKGT